MKASRRLFIFFSVFFVFSNVLHLAYGSTEGEAQTSREEGCTQKITDVSCTLDPEIYNLEAKRKDEFLKSADTLLKGGLLLHAEKTLKPGSHTKGYYFCEAGKYTLMTVLALGMGLNLFVIHSGELTGQWSKVAGFTSGIPVSIMGLKGLGGAVCGACCCKEAGCYSCAKRKHDKDVEDGGSTKLMLSTKSALDGTVTINNKEINIKDFHQIDIFQEGLKNNGKHKSGFWENLLTGLAVFSMAAVDASFDAMLGGQALECFFSPTGGGTPGYIGFGLGFLANYLPGGCIAGLGAIRAVNGIKRMCFESGDSTLGEPDLLKLPINQWRCNNFEEELTEENIANISNKMCKRVVKECAQRGYGVVDQGVMVAKHKEWLEYLLTKPQDVVTESKEDGCLNCRLQEKVVNGLLTVAYMMDSKPAAAVGALGMAVCLAYFFAAEVVQKALGGGQEALIASNTSTIYPSLGTTVEPQAECTSLVHDYLTYKQLAIWSMVAYTFQGFDVFSLARDQVKKAINDTRAYARKDVRDYINLREPEYFRKQVAKFGFGCVLMAGYIYNAIGVYQSMTDLKEGCNEWWCSALCAPAALFFGVGGLALTFGYGAELCDKPFGLLIRKYDNWRNARKKDSIDAKKKAHSCLQHKELLSESIF